MPDTLDRRPTDEYRLARYLAAWPTLTVDEAAAELAALDADRRGVKSRQVSSICRQVAGRPAGEDDR